MRALLFALLLLLPLAVQSSESGEQLPNATVIIVEDEIEIEHIDTSVWSQWVYNHDENGVEYIIFHENGDISFETKPYSQDDQERM